MASLTPRILIVVISALAFLAFPALAGAVTQVSVQTVPGVGQVVVVNDDGASSTIDVENGITPPVDGSVRYVAARNNAGGMQAGAGCGANGDNTVVACEGVFAALVVFANGGNDKVTMDLIVNESPLNAEAYGGDGDDELKATPDNRNVPQPTTHIEGEAGNDAIERVPVPFDRARTLLLLGVVRRRGRQRRSAREALEQACTEFERLGAAVWHARARGELGRLGGRAPSDGTLTPSEHKVAALVAEGRTNREVAAELVVSEKTVESHLSHVYRKLGVRSRAELTRRFPDD